MQTFAFRKILYGGKEIDAFSFSALFFYTFSPYRKGLFLKFHNYFKTKISQIGSAILEF